MSKKTPVEKKPIRDLLSEKDAFLTTSERAYEYFLRHTRGLAAAAAAVVLLVIGVAVYMHQREKAEEEAAVALEQALNAAAASQADPAAGLKALEQVRTDFPDRKAARLAAFSLVGLYAAQGQADQALALAENLLQTLKTSEVSLKPLLLSNLAGLYEVKKDYLKAAKSYEAMLALTPLDPNLKQDVLLSLGRVHSAAGQKDEAVKQYQALVTEFPQSYTAYLANLRLSELKGEAVAFPLPAPATPPAAAAAALAEPAAPVDVPAPAADSSAAEPAAE